ncbi:AEC family transporter [Cryobacterium tepidiphilum]|uniref:AEC family transporter n=1 Tax=Cryobacterium tepidiphilum TaxID=2486026 RepID=A0A3M8LS08_9MICO|nr:AEC family transporter [Cryobacterium tepidiphilum]RNE67278.1 AEC family transporter [Cryobacterium tepidiphilum]
MGGVLIGFGIIGFVILVGYIVQRSGVTGPSGRVVLNRVAFFVATPALLFTVLEHADVRVLLSSFLATVLCSVLVGAVLYVVLSRILFPRPLAETALGTAGSMYVNANNIGLPVAVYVLGDAQYVAPVLLLQLLVLAPATLMLLDISTSGRVSARSIITQPVRNPMIIASVAGVAVAALHIDLPDALLAPLELIGGAAIPLVLMAFGMSLHGERPLQAGTGRKQVAAASLIKVAVMPLTAWLFGRFVFGLDGADLFAVVAVATLPTAQNIYNFAARYGRGEVVARDTILVTTVASIPALLVVAALLA